MTEAVTYSRVGPLVGLIMLNRSTSRNSMTADLLEAFAAASAAARADSDARCVIISGSGGYFSAGADLRELGRDDTGGSPFRTRAEERLYAMYVPFLSVLDIEVPVIAALNGHAIGGGFGLALLCDVRIAARDAKYGANFCRLGLSPGLGISYLLPRLIGASSAGELMFTGRLIKGDEAVRIGIASESHSEEQVLPRALELAGEIAASAPLAVRATKRCMRDGLAWDVRAAARREAQAQAATLSTADFAEGVAALLGKRTPNFRGL